MPSIRVKLLFQTHFTVADAMKKYVLFILTALFLQACSNDKTAITTQTTQPKVSNDVQTAIKTPKPSGKQWNGTSLSEATIKTIQKGQYHYKQCVYKEAQKRGYTKIDSRVATDSVIKQCEPSLAKIRETFTNEGVPEVITQRFLKKTRVDMTRKILKSLMFAEASRKAGVIQ